MAVISDRQPGRPDPADLLITAALLSRVPATRDFAAQDEAVHALPDLLAARPSALAGQLLDIAIEFCHAGSAGIGWLEQPEPGDPLFRWTAVAGRFAAYRGGKTARNFSLCGLCLDLGRPILIADPVRLFPYLSALPVPLVEALVAPIYTVGRYPLGTIWIVTHDELRKFDLEDLLLMTRLADFAAACPTAAWPTAAGPSPLGTPELRLNKYPLCNSRL